MNLPAHITRLMTFAQHGQPKEYGASDMMRSDLEQLIKQAYIPATAVSEAEPAKPVRGNTGHGHIWSRPDGLKAKCGGPTICAVCAKDAASVATPPAAAVSEAERVEPVALPGDLVIKALQAMDAEERKRGEMCPQTLDEQREGSKAVRNVIKSLEFYTSGNQCRNGWPSVKGWPALPVTPPAAAVSEALTDDAIWRNEGIMAANSGYGASFATLREVVRAVEAAHGIGVNE